MTPAPGPHLLRFMTSKRQARHAALGALLARVIPDVTRAQAQVVRAGRPAQVLRLRQLLRRLRMLLTLLQREAPSPQLADVRDKARAMTAALGRLRALDAFRMETLPRATAAGLGRQHATRLTRGTAKARAAALAEAQIVLASDTLADFGSQLAQLPAVRAAALVVTPKLATEMLGRLHRRMLALGRGFGHADSEARHKLRLAGKALVELAALVETDVPLRQRPIRRVTRLTAAIGGARDREQALAIVEGLVAPEASTALAAALAGISHADDRRLRRRWRAFRRAPPPRPKRR